MARQISDATLLRTVRRDNKDLLRERAELINQVAHWKGRALNAEKELTEWKARFDILLRREPKESGNG